MHSIEQAVEKGLFWLSLCLMDTLMKVRVIKRNSGNKNIAKISFFIVNLGALLIIGAIALIAFVYLSPFFSLLLIVLLNLFFCWAVFRISPGDIQRTWERSSDRYNCRGNFL